jgi:hypothetical protein
MVRGVLAAAFGAAWIGGLALSSPAGAAARCPAPEAVPEVSLEIKPGRVVYDASKSRKQIQRLQSDSGGGGAKSSKRGWKPIGLTLTELKFRMNISVSTVSRSDGRHCATVAAVKATLGYEKITVHVDKRYRRGSCQYRSVLEHEKEHVSIFRGVLDRYAPKVERRLVQAATGLKPITAGSPQQAANKLQNALQRRVEPLFKEMNRTMDRENDTIDTAANYKREQARCPKW